MAVESDLAVDLGFASVIFAVGNGCTFVTSLCGLEGAAYFSGRVLFFTTPTDAFCDGVRPLLD